jgi:competence protein ComEC
MVGGRGVLASTLAAQIGTMPVSLAVFGSVPVVSLVANPLALPVAGTVMTVGLPLSLLASAVPAVKAPVSWGLSLLVGWVDTVARVASVLSPDGALNVALWMVVVVWVVARWNRVRRLTSVAG